MPTEWHSQAGQDRIVDRLFPGGGFYVEIGAGEPFTLSNSAALEAKGWRGVSIERDEFHAAGHAEKRRNRCVCADALLVDWKTLGIDADARVEYLSVDIDDWSLVAMTRFLETGCRPQFVTFEHNRYYSADTFAKPARELMAGLGYELLCSDVRLMHFTLGDYAFEDWFVLKPVPEKAWAIKCHDKSWEEIHALAGLTSGAAV